MKLRIFRLYTKSLRTTIQMKAVEQRFTFCRSSRCAKGFPTLKSVDEILECDHSNESQ